MDKLYEPSEPRKLIAPDDWESFLENFTERNKDRRARFDVFRKNGAVEEENQESHLEKISFVKNDKKVEVVRIDRTENKNEKVENQITKVKSLFVQYDTDGSEDALEFLDNEDALISLRMESKVDGAS